MATRYLVYPYDGHSHIIDVIDEESFKDIQWAKDVMSARRFIEGAFSIMLHNYTDFTTTVLALAEDYRIRPTNEPKITDNSFIRLNAKLTNLLSSFRLYIEISDTNYSSPIFSKSDAKELLKEKTRSLYDNTDDYAFFYKLRNYAQHCGFPIDYLTKGGTRVKISSVENLVYITPSMQRNKAIPKYGSWGDKAKEFINNYPSGQINLVSVSSSVVHRVVTLHKEMQKHLEEDLSQSTKILYGYQNKAEDHAKRHGISLVLPAVRPQKPLTSLGEGEECVSIWVKGVDEVNELVRLNAQIGGIGTCNTILKYDKDK